MDGNAATNTAAQAAENTAAEQHSTNAAQQQVAGNEGAGESKATTPDIDALIQRAVERATNKLGNENKKLRGELEAARKASMTSEELRKAEIDDREKELESRARALTEKENRLIAIKEIKAAGLDDGSDASLAIVDFVMADDEEGIKERVKAFNDLVERIVKAKVDGIFKQNGRTPGVGSDTAANAGGQTESIAARLGRNAANANKTAQSVLEHYTRGGKK